MTGSRTRPAIIVAGLLLGLLAVTLPGVQGEGLENVPSEDQCRPYIEKALKDLGTEGSHEHESAEDAEAANDGSDEGPGVDPAADTNDDDEKSGSREKRDISGEEQEDGDDEKTEGVENNEVEQDLVDTIEITSVEEADAGNESTADDNADDNADEDGESNEVEDKSKETEGEESAEKQDDDEHASEADEGDASQENNSGEEEAAVAEEDESVEKKEEDGADDESNEKDDDPADNVESDEQKTEELEQSQEQDEEVAEDGSKSGEEDAATTGDDDDGDSKEKAESAEEAEDQKEDKSEEKGDDDGSKEDGDDKKSIEEEEVVAEKAESLEQEAAADASEEAKTAEDDGKSEEDQKEGDTESKENEEAKSDEAEGEEGEQEAEDKEGDESEEGEESRPEEEELIMEIEIPEILRPRDHINQLLKLDEENEQKEKAVGQVADIVLRDLKRLYDNAIKPLETLYKYRDLSNRHFGDPEIFSKPLVLFMGPWSGGKSSIINYLLDIEYKPTSLRTGAEPSPAYFNILMHGEEEEVLDGTQLAADWTFSGLQKFGQGLLDRLKGVKLNSKLLEKVNIVEIPGILEIRKQVQRLFPFNDACQWFIDRADIIFLVYDPSKLDVGPETEAILDQLKGREYQTRIILNKADQVKPEELMRVQGALIWNISPLMSSAEPPIMYSASLWSIPYEAGAPTRLLYAQERAFLRDLRSAVDKRVEHKIASARRFAVRVRNHAKMVDCYLTTYYNHKSFFAKKKDISDRIIENPQDYHIYEGLSTLTNISRYDLPDPDVYRDFFRLNSLYEFPLLSSTCTYFRGCPINRLDVAIAYDLPELVGKYKKSVEAVLHQQDEAEAVAAPASTPAPQAQETGDRQKRGARSGAARISMS